MKNPSMIGICHLCLMALGLLVPRRKRAMIYFKTATTMKKTCAHHPLGKLLAMNLIRTRKRNRKEKVGVT